MFESYVNGIYIPSINSFFFLIEKNANSSLRAWAVLNFCDSADVVKETKKLLERDDALGFSTFFNETVQKTSGNVGEDFKYCNLSRKCLNDLLIKGCVFFGFVRDPVERSVSIYNDKLERLIPEDEQLDLGGKKSKHTREMFIERLGIHIGATNLLKRLYSSPDHVREYKAQITKASKNTHFMDRHISQQFELISPIAELMMSSKSEVVSKNSFFLLDCKDSCYLDGLLKSVTYYKTDVKMEKIKLRRTKEKVDFTKEEKKELSKILVSDYEFMSHAKQFLFRMNSDT